jgi:hypothetical protein
MTISLKGEILMEKEEKTVSKKTLRKPSKQMFGNVALYVTENTGSTTYSDQSSGTHNKQTKLL